LWSAKEAMFKWWGRGDVDFSEVLRIWEMPNQMQGKINASFQKNEIDIALQLDYLLMHELTLFWVNSKYS
jgi:phosphopantetheinyl transferase (holo-ACP synthase)